MSAKSESAIIFTELAFAGIARWKAGVLLFMDPDEIIHYICLEENSQTPQYLQVAYAIIAVIRKCALKQANRLPTVSAVSSRFGIPKNAVRRGYQYLCRLEIMTSCAGKGYGVGAYGRQEWTGLNGIESDE